MSIHVSKQFTCLRVASQTSLSASGSAATRAFAKQGLL
jgi:hypothetical protein